jgi:hypothetical protein
VDQGLDQVAGQVGAQGTAESDPDSQGDPFPRGPDRLVVPAEEFQHVGQVHITA